MYDNIKLSLRVDFAETEQNEFCSRFGLCTKNEKLSIWHNKDNKNLTQNLKENKGIFIHLKNSTLTLEFSLHKVFNYYVYGKRFNYNDFNFNEVRTAGGWLYDLFKPYFDITQAVVKKYEVGINVLTSENPDLYLQELKQINVNAKVLPIKEDIHYKEYKQFSTQRDKDKRVIYIFYNKTFEARTKERKDINRVVIPDNVLRVEKDNKRPPEKILFSELLNINFQKRTICEFKQRFCNDLEFKGVPIKPKTMKHFDFEMFKLVFDKGTDGAKAQIKTEFENGTIKQTCYYKRLRCIEQISTETTEIQTEFSRRAVELNNLIINKIRKLRESVHF